MHGSRNVELATPVARARSDRKLRFRAAVLADAEILLAWRNDPMTRQFSSNNGVVTPARHARWLQQTLADPQVELAVVECDGAAIGTVRYERAALDTELSWTIAPTLRGRGFGTRVLRAAAARVEGSLRARIHQDNVASQRMASAAGFARVASDGVWTLWLRPAADSAALA